MPKLLSAVTSSTSRIGTRMAREIGINMASSLDSAEGRARRSSFALHVWRGLIAPQTTVEASMRSLLAILLFAAAIQGAPAAAQSSASPLLGSWAVDVSRLPLPPEARPKSVTFRFSEAGQN